MKRCLGALLLLAAVGLLGCSSEKERGQNRDKDRPRSAPEKQKDKALAPAAPPSARA